ncbi:adenine nucleotide alpha hydrolase family protein, partial [Desulfovibrio sp. OttesenSCG-928-C06]|nr:adenine nucleotide alpha hydrolase family protein [Desulfovibrio sp. OttesenSCG-928-C06]
LELSRQGYNVTGLHIDLAIGESSRLARLQVERFCDKHSLNLQVLDMAEEGLPIPLVKEKLKRPICSACGKIKRHYFNKAALDGKYDAIATGHNLDDEISRLFSNVLRWDASYLGEQGPLLPAEEGFARKVKPLWRLGEFETANYAYLMGIDWHTMPCPYSKGASFSIHKKVWADLEHHMPGKRLNFYLEFLEHGRKNFAGACRESEESLAPCPRCGYPTSSDLCGVCRIKDMLA